MMKRMMVLLAIGLLVAGAAAAGYSYTSYRGEKLTLYPWMGQHVIVLTAKPDRDPKMMAKILKTFDRIYEFYHQATGREPRRLERTFVDGRSTVAVVQNTCGAGCGMLGCTGIELMPGAFDTLYDGVEKHNQWDQVIFYEFGRNYWFYGPQLEYRSPDNSRAIVTGYAVFMRFMAMEAAGVEGGPFRDKSFKQFKADVEGLVDLYEKNPSLTWANTLREDKAPSNPLGLNGTDLFAGFCFRLRRQFGNAFIAQLWREAGKRPAAKTTQDAIDNFVIAASAAAGQDLGPLFAQRWRWPVSESGRQQARAAAHRGH